MPFVGKVKAQLRPGLALSDLKTFFGGECYVTSTTPVTSPLDQSLYYEAIRHIECELIVESMKYNLLKYFTYDNDENLSFMALFKSFKKEETSVLQADWLLPMLTLVEQVSFLTHDVSVVKRELKEHQEVLKANQEEIQELKRRIEELEKSNRKRDKSPTS